MLLSSSPFIITFVPQSYKGLVCAGMGGRCTFCTVYPHFKTTTWFVKMLQVTPNSWHLKVLTHQAAVSQHCGGVI